MSRINNNNLKIYLNTVDVSNDLSVVSGEKALVLGAASYLYLGYKKPVHSVYVDVAVANANSTIMIVEKFNGTWDVVDRQDDTFGLKKSGFIFTDDFDNEVKTTYQGQEMYWIRISMLSNTLSLSLRYLNLVLNSFEDLKAEESDIEVFYPVNNLTNEDIKTFIGSQIAARDEILGRLNQGGKFKYNGSEYSLLTQWDLFNVNELRRASKFYCLHKIFLNRFDEKNDAYMKKAEHYFSLFDESFNLFKGLFTSDSNDDGKLDSSEIVDSKASSYRIPR